MYWDIFDEIERMSQEMNKMLVPIRNSKAQQEDGFRTPVAEVKETEKNMLVTFELPGVDKKDIELNVNDDSVEVNVQKESKSEKKTDEGYSYQKSSSSFYRKVPLPKQVIAEKADASYKNGILRLEIPKKSEKLQGTKRIQIK